MQWRYAAYLVADPDSLAPPGPQQAALLDLLEYQHGNLRVVLN